MSTWGWGIPAKEGIYLPHPEQEPKCGNVSCVGFDLFEVSGASLTLHVQMCDMCDRFTDDDDPQLIQAVQAGFEGLRRLPNTKLRCEATCPCGGLGWLLVPAKEGRTGLCVEGCARLEECVSTDWQRLLKIVRDGAKWPRQAR